MKFVIVRLPVTDIYIREYVDSLTYYLTEAGHTVDISTWDCLPEEYDVILYFHSAFYTLPQCAISKPVVLMNVEQLTRSDYLTLTLSILQENPHFVYADYSTANLAIVKQHTGRDGFWLPFFHTPHMPPPATPSDTDILLFYGELSTYRKNVCDAYGATYIYAFGADRDASIRSARAVLNCHFSEEYRIFESLRVYHAIYNGIPVLQADESLPEKSYLSEQNQRFICRSWSKIPALPPPTFDEEHETARRLVTEFLAAVSKM